MGALRQPIPRRAAQSETPDESRRFDFRFWQKLRWIIPALAQGQGATMSVLWSILIRANENAKDGSVSGPTAPFTSADLADEANTTQHRINQILRDCGRKSNETKDDAAFELFSIEEAEAAGLIAKAKQGKKARAAGYVAIPLVKDWERIARAIRKKWAEPEPDEPEADETDELPPAAILKVTDEPLLFTAGKPRPQPLTPAVRAALRRNPPAQIVIETDLPGSFLSELHLDGDTWRQVFRAAPQVVDPMVDHRVDGKCISHPSVDSTGVAKNGRTNGNLHQNAATSANGKSISRTSVDSKRVARDVQQFLEPIFLEWFSKPVDAELAGRIAAALRECPVNHIEGPCYAKTVQARIGRKGAGRISTGLFVDLAADAREAWIKTESIRQQLERRAGRREDPKAFEDLTRDEQIQEIASNLEFVAMLPEHPETARISRELRAVQSHFPEVYKAAAQKAGAL